MRALNLNEAVASPVQQAVALLQRNPETATLAAVLATMHIKPDTTGKVETCCTDAIKQISYSPEWFGTLPIPEIATTLAHESFHKIGMIHLRFEDWAPRYPTIPVKILRLVFNHSHDYLINHSLKHDWLLPLPECGLYNPYYHMGKYTIETLADKLLKEYLQENPPPPPCAGGQGGKSQKGKGDGDSGEKGAGGSRPGEDEDDGESGDGSDSDTSGQDHSDTDTSGGEGEEDDDEAGGGTGGDGDTQPDSPPIPDDKPQPGDGGFGKGDDVSLPPDESEGAKGKGKPGSGGARAAGDVDVHVPMSEDAKNEMRATIKRDMAECERMLNGLGIHAGDERTHGVFGDLSEVPVHSLRGELAKLAHRVMKDKRSYTHPNKRRGWPTGVHKPGLRADKIGTLVIYVDTSGSTSGDGWVYFLRTMRETLKGTKFDDVWVIHVDHEVEMPLHYTSLEFVSDEKVDSEIYGGGGTQFHPAFEWGHENLIAKGKRIAAAIYFTDGQVGHSSLAESYRIWKLDQRYPLLWALWGDQHWVNTFINWVRDDKKFGVTSVLPADAW